MPAVLFILLLAMVVLGPKKLPQLAAQIGQYLARFQRMKREMMDQVNAEVLRLDGETKVDDVASAATEPG
jgi:Sec-independent protein translocase protein TatA